MGIFKKNDSMDNYRKELFLKYISYLCEKPGGMYQYTGMYIKCVRVFLEEADSISRGGYHRFRKSHASMLIDYPFMEKAVCDLLDCLHLGYSRYSKRKSKEEKPLEKLSVISEKNRKTMNEFLASLMDGFDYSPNTLAVYKTAVQKFYEYANEFSQENCRRYVATMEAEGMHPKTIRLRITALEKLGKYLKKPVLLKRPKISKSLDTNNIPTEEEYNKLLEYLSGVENRDYYFMVRVLASTGARVSEFMEIKWEDIINGEVTLKGKGNKYRRFFFNAALQKEVKAYMKETGKTGYIAMGRFGRITQRGLNQNLKSWGDKCGIDRKKMHPHAFRHFFAKMYLKKTNDVVQLADLLGHGSIDITRIYLQKSYEEQRKDFNRSVTW